LPSANPAPQVLLLGGSTIERWKTTGKTLWDEHIAPLGLKIQNAGVGGDKTQNVLYRLEKGLLDNINPSKVILLIGMYKRGIE